MNVKSSKILKILTVFAVFSGLFFNTTCNMPMGMGDAIDFEPPVLTLDPVPSPYYVRDGAKLSGSVTDNVGVDRVELRVTSRHDDSDNKLKEIISRISRIPVTINGNNWEIELKFGDLINQLVGELYPQLSETNKNVRIKEYEVALNGTKMTLDIIAFDRMGNSNDLSIKTITIIIDTAPPVTETMTVKRSDTREAFFESYNDLKTLKDEPRLMERVANVNRFQNGFFNILATISEEETRINDTLRLNIYDADKDIDQILLQIAITADSSLYSPKWLISETVILAAGEKLWPGYSAAYEAGTSYIYRVATEVHDKSMNEGITLEEEGYFLMSFNADEPKGILDPIVGSTVTRGGTIPVEFFDDDTLLWAYTGLLTYEQWHGTEPIASGVFLPKTEDGKTDKDKLEFLQERLRADQPVYNWRYDRYNGNTSEPVEELIKGRTLNERTIYLLAGNNETDYGQFFLFSLVADKKLDPHTNTGPRDTNRTRTKGRHWPIDVIDENAPLIVLDVENGCPEENTFPTLTDGEFFTVKGYTLRENGNKQNGVIKLRMAWIPSGKSGGADSYIPAVQAALRADNYPASVSDNPNLAGVQYWDFGFAHLDIDGLTYIYNSDDDEKFGDSFFRRQPFERTFSVLGNSTSHFTKNPQPPLAGATWKDFHYNCAPGGCALDDNGNPVCRENENKLFVIFAECNMGHQVYRQMRLLGNRTPPNLYVYDISGNILDQRVNELTSPSIPNVQLPEFGLGVPNSAYDDALSEFNKSDDVYTLFKNISMNAGSFIIEERQRAIPFQMYTWGTMLKYWARALPNGDLRVSEIRMIDITTDITKPAGSDYRSADNSLIFVEYYPDEAQRVFLFEAVDSLGNIARMQRTIAVTNAARLEKITTETLNGTYGIGDVIELQADFSGQIRVELGTQSQRPLLNVRYPVKNPTTGVVTHIIDQLPAYIETPGDDITKPTLFLKFRFTVPVNAVEDTELQTMFENTSMGGDSAADKHTDRPLSLLRDTKIIDVNRDQHAFIPGYTIGNASMPNWITATGSLQGGVPLTSPGKSIFLDGIRPVITGVSINAGKTAHSTDNYYFKDGDAIELTITADKPILNSDMPHLQFIIRNLADNDDLETNHTSFAYARQGGTNSLVFSLPVTSIARDGRISSITIYTGAGSAGMITDRVGNELIHTGNLKTFDASVSGMNLYIKRVLPAAPVVTLRGNSIAAAGVSLTTAAATYNHDLTVQIASSAASGSFNAWEDTIQYSTDGGLNWIGTYNDSSRPVFGNGTYNLRARYVDRAGNEGAHAHRCSGTVNHTTYSCAQTIQLNTNFPRLIGITAVQPPATYIRNDTLQFKLDFDANVTLATNQTANVVLELEDLTASANTPGGTGTTYQNSINATAATTGTNTITFTWTLAANTKDMLNGLKIRSLNLSGLRDSFENSGPASAGITLTWNNATTGGTATYNGNAVTNYNLSGISVSTITPTVRSREPQNAQGRTGNITQFTADPDTVTSTVASGSISTDNKTIRITFSKPMQKGNGTITIRPHGNYAIPAVFENEGYYVGINNTGQIVTDANGFEYTYTTSDITTADTGLGIVAKTWVAGFSDIFNNVSSANKTTLIGTDSMAAPTLSATTGLSVGPYLKTTHGLKRGAGFTGNYNNSTPGVNAPGSSGTAYMVPDISTKWVLRYSIEDIFGTNNTTAENTVVTNIRTVLDNAKFRWQEIAVTQSNVNFSADRRTVIINLTEPLLPGLQWTLHYDAGTFADEAGTPVAASARGAYWFWSGGVQKPVIRVERKSYDARTAANVTATAQTNPTYTADGHAGTIASFDTVAYRIVSETPNSRIFYNTQLGSASTGNGFTRGSALGAWEGDINTTTLADITSGTTIKWEGTKANAGHNVGAWVRPNLIFRNNTGTTAVSYTVMDEGVQTPRAVNSGYFGLRSYNRDASVTDLAISDANLTNTTTTGRVTANIPFGTANALQASKNYIVANTRIDHSNVPATGSNYSAATYTSQRGYEGVYRTVLMMNQIVNTGTNPTTNYPPKVNGSTRQSGLPTIAGFPLKDNATGNDSRYMKVMYRVGTGNTDRQWYWVSTEIVSQIYIQIHGRGIGTNTSFGTQGDSYDWMTMGYGDLTYCLGWQ